MAQRDMPIESTLTKEAGDAYFKRWEGNFKSLCEMLVEIAREGDVAAFAYVTQCIERVLNETFKALSAQAQAPADPRAN